MKPLLEPANKISLEKLAYTTQLGKDAKEWPITILQEAYKQVPYLRNYEVDVSLDRTDESRGYGVGKMVVYPHRMDKTAAAKSDRIVSFPIIIRDHEVAPLDVISHKDQIRPASESYISETLFTPDVFEGSARKGQFSATGLGAQIDPPAQRLRQSVGIHKYSSVGILDAALVSATAAQINEVKEALTKSAGLRYAAVSNPAFGQAIERIISTKEKTASSLASLRQETIKPSVVQFRKEGSSYFVKTANHTAYDPVEKEITRFDAQGYLSNLGFQQLCSEGFVTYTVDPVQKKTEIIKEASAINHLGYYEVYSGKDEVTGMVIPNMVDLDGRDMYTKLFITKTASAMQEDIAGRFVEKANLPASFIRGKGVFAMQDGNRALATEVIDIQNKVETNFGKEKVAYYVGKRLSTGETIKISTVDGIHKIASMGTGHYAIPSFMTFVSLPAGRISIASQSSDYREREMLKKASSVRLISDGQAWQLKGTSFTDIMDKRDTYFALGAHGLSSEQSANLIKKASETGSANIYEHRDVKKVSDIKEAIMSKVAKSKVNVTGLQVDLIKEASAIVEKETVDSILALRFLTPENVGMYINYLPELEKTAAKLAEILVASRLGMDDIKEVAAKNALSQMTSVIDGLSGLRSKVM